MTRMRDAWVALMFAAAAGMAAPACSSDSGGGGREVCTNGKDDNGDGRTDCADPQCSSDPACKSVADGGLADLGLGDGPVADTAPPDSGFKRSLSETVVNKLTLPKKKDDFAADIDGDKKKDNRLGELLGLVAATAKSLDLQSGVDLQIRQGALLWLIAIDTPSLTNATKVTARFHLGADLDLNPNDNFSGNEPLGIAKNSPKNVSLTGSIKAGKLALGPGTLTFPLPLPPGKLTNLKLVKARVEGDIGKGGISRGTVTGAIPTADLDGKLLPALATLLTDMIKGRYSVPQDVSKALKALFDSNGDDKITVAELKGSLVGKLLAPDVDTDGDTKPDALSVALGFTSVPCIITP